MSDLRTEIDKWVGTVLPERNKYKDWCKRFTEPKIIHDALWGTFSLKSHEVSVLDSPMIQRLRRIHQTGAASLTFPCALHTRFEHSLGVLHHSDRMISALKLNHSEDHRLHEGNLINIRMAALLHDSGHGPYSHTSEQFFSNLSDINAWKDHDARFENSGAGEFLSCLIVESPTFRRFIQQVKSHFKQDINPDLISDLISGNVDPNQRFLAEIIHGPFDADKLDYMHRDGMYSGLKMHIDLDRLYSSIGIMSGNEGGKELTRLAGSMTGTSPLMQIMFNKMILYTGLYHHHKVRSADCMLWAIFNLAIERRAKLGGRRMELTSDFLYVTDDTLLIPDLCDDDEIAALIERVRDRNLWKRALVLARETVSTIEGPFTKLSMLGGNEPEKIKRRRAISDLIWEEAGKPCKKYEVWLDVPSQPSVKEGRQMWIRSGDQTVPRLLYEILPVDAWVKLYGTSQWRAHVFAPDEARKKIGFAACKVLKDTFDLDTNDRATEYCKFR